MNLIKFAIILFIFSAYAQSEKKKLLFLDLNKNPMEVEAAKRAAKKNNQTVITYPNGDDQMDENNLKKLFEENTFSSMVISGHNGGSSYDGDKGHIEIENLLSMIQKTSSSHSIQSLYLLGCNSANKSKIFFWKQGIPELKFIAGYDGTAPLGKNINGIQYFEDALSKENLITRNKDFEKFKSLITNLRSVHDLPASVYASCGANHSDYLYLPDRSSNERFGGLNSNECVNKITEFKEKYLETIKQYWSGSLEPTTLNPSSGFLKDAYVFMRQNEHCFSDEDSSGPFSSYNGDNLLFLRFSKAFNENFLEYYHDDFKEILRELNELTDTPELFAEKSFNAQSDARKTFEDILKNPQIYKPVIDKEIEELRARITSFLKKNPEVEQCLAHPTQTCARLKTKFMEYYGLKNKKDELDNYQTTIREAIKDPITSLKEYYAGISKSEEIKRLKTLLEKAIETPSLMTRKELMELANKKSLLPYNIYYGESARFISYMYGIESLDGYDFPFSWHERIQNRKVEEPKLDRLKNRGYFESRFPKDLEPLARILDQKL